MLRQIGRCERTKFVFRELARKAASPWCCLHHLTAVLDDWDPRSWMAWRRRRHVIRVRQSRVGGSGGATPKTVRRWRGMPLPSSAPSVQQSRCVRLLARRFRLPGCRATAAGLVRKIILAGTGRQAAEAREIVGAICRTRSARRAPQQASEAFSVLYASSNGQAAADASWDSLKERTGDLDTAVSNDRSAQIAAIQAGTGGCRALGKVQHPSGRQWRSRRDGADRSIPSNWPAGCRMRN